MPKLWRKAMSIPDVVRMAVLGVLYVATATFGLSLDAVSGFAAAVWPPTGIALAAGLSTLISATLGVTSGWLGGSIPGAAYGKAWRTWWLGDALGDLVVAPLLFVWSGRGRSALSRYWLAEALMLLVAVGALSLA